MTLEQKLDIIKGILALGDIWGQADEVKMRNTALQDAVEYGSNYWKVVLKLALADSGIYKENLNNKILKQ